MYTLYKTIKHDTDIKGYWIDSNKLYIDNIVINKYIDYDIFKMDCIELLKTELCIFYIIDGIGYIKDRQGNIIKLSKRIKILKKHITKKHINELCKKYNGCTVFKNTIGYMIYIYTR